MITNYKYYLKPEFIHLFCIYYQLENLLQFQSTIKTYVFVLLFMRVMNELLPIVSWLLLLELIIKVCKSPLRCSLISSINSKKFLYNFSSRCCPSSLVFLLETLLKVLWIFCLGTSQPKFGGQVQESSKNLVSLFYSRTLHPLKSAVFLLQLLGIFFIRTEFCGTLMIVIWLKASGTKTIDFNTCTVFYPCYLKFRQMNLIHFIWILFIY